MKGGNACQTASTPLRRSPLRRVVSVPLRRCGRRGSRGGHRGVCRSRTDSGGGRPDGIVFSPSRRRILCGGGALRCCGTDIPRRHRGCCRSTRCGRSRRGCRWCGRRQGRGDEGLAGCGGDRARGTVHRQIAPRLPPVAQRQPRIKSSAQHQQDVGADEQPHKPRARSRILRHRLHSARTASRAGRNTQTRSRGSVIRPQGRPLGNGRQFALGSASGTLGGGISMP